MKRRTDEWVQDLDGRMSTGEVEAILARLDAAVAPDPSPDQTRELVARLRPLMPRGGPASDTRFRAAGLEQPLFTLFRCLILQARLFFRPVWWLGSLAAVAAGLLAAPALAELAIPLSALAPVMVIAGVAYGFRSLRGAALELELSCAVTPAQAVLSRILLMMGYYLLLGAAAALAGAGPFLTLLLSWCAALTLFTGLMLALTLYTGAIGAAVLTFSFWGLELVTRQLWPGLFSQPGTTAWLPAQMAALAAGLALGAFALSRPSLTRLAARRDA